MLSGEAAGADRVLCEAQVEPIETKSSPLSAPCGSRQVSHERAGVMHPTGNRRFAAGASVGCEFALRACHDCRRWTL